MKLIVLAIIVGVIALAVIVIYMINSGVIRLRAELNVATNKQIEAEEKLSIARRALYEIAGNQAGNPSATAFSAIDTIEGYNNRKGANR